jgi:hypothetical protein
MKLIVFIAAHKNETQINRLIKALAHPDITVYIHLDKKSKVNPADILSEAKIIRNSMDVTWGTFSQVESTINGLREIMANEPDFDCLAFISGQDYPVLPPEAILNSLSENQGKEMIDFTTLDQDGWNKARIRFERYYFGSYNNRLIRFAGNILTFSCDKIRWKRSFYKGMKPFGGPSWWTLSRDCIQYVLNFTDAHKGYARFMKKTIHADEMFFHTIVMNSPFKDRAYKNNFRFIKWQKVKENAHPNILVKTDFQEIVNSQNHFARKFDIEIDAQILDLVDDCLNQKGAAAPQQITS